ncbi:MAG: glutamine-hydrolyzing GMP synthase [Candidatus Eisenbacteria bacterium]|nr:glutamine-hydrolyzing GMP synthase [Candidatus Eisenbacteria bacterium]
MSIVAVIDFGSQYNLLIARRVRQLGLYAELFPYDVDAETLRSRGASALILSGSPASAVDGRYLPRPEILALGLPVLGICYGMQAVSHLLGGRVVRGTSGEYGRQRLAVIEPGGLLDGLEEPIEVWMSHGDQVVELPDGYRTLARTATCPHAAVANPARKIFLVQFHPEVSHTPQGMKVLSNFLFGLAGLCTNWSLEDFTKQSIESIRRQVGDGVAVCGVSGGVDSTVAAVLCQRALGERLHAIFVDSGLLRLGEVEWVCEKLLSLGIHVHLVEASDRFLAALAGVEDPEEKRKRIGRLFIEVFDEAAQRLGHADFLVQGTLYPDVIESQGAAGPSARIKSHHNVGGLPERMRLRLVEPLRELFKDEVREVGKGLGIPSEMLGRHPSPGPGLAVRIAGEVNKERLDLLRAADAIFMEELRQSGTYDQVWQAFTVLLPVRSVGVMGDERTYGLTVVLRAVTSVDGMTADWARLPAEVLERSANRIVNETGGVNRVLYDVTSKPPATIEWE